MVQLLWQYPQGKKIRKCCGKTAATGSTTTGNAAVVSFKVGSKRVKPLIK